MRCFGCMKEKTQSPICEHCGFDENNKNQVHQLPIGTVLRDQYQIGKVLGQGGFGVTYLGWDLYLDTPVAIKEYYPSGSVVRENTMSLEVRNCSPEGDEMFQSDLRRFMNEAKALARFNTVPQVVQVHSFFPANNTAYIIMEYVKGVTLKDYIRRKGTLSLDQTLKLLVPVMSALAKIHESGIIHRDISPDNIMLTADGGVKLLDFGAVRDVRGVTPDGQLAQSTVAILKHGFAPVEQYQTRGALGPWTDVYSMTATLLYCMTGKVLPEALDRLMDDDLRLDQLLPDLTDSQRAAIAHGLAPRADRRTASMADLVRELTTKAQPQPQPQPQPMEVEATSRVRKPEPVENKPQSVPVQPVDPNATVRVRHADRPAVSSAANYEPVARKEKRSFGWLWVPLAIVLVIAVVAGLASRPEETFPVEEVYEEEMSDTEETFVVDEYTSYENVLMQSNLTVWSETANEEPFLSTDLRRDQVLSVTFLDTLENASGTAVDVSELGNGKVLAWYTPNGEYYDVYIGAEGGVMAPNSCEYLFFAMCNLESITFGGSFDTSNVTDMYSMFRGCSSLTALDVSGFDTSNVTDMDWMFYGCSSLTALDVSGFDTSNVMYMSYMFYDCSSLTELDVSGFNTSNITNMICMFYGCSSLTALDVSGFDTSNVVSMSSMFGGCSSLTALDVSGFDISSVETMDDMFYGCDSLPESVKTTFQ